MQLQAIYLRIAHQQYHFLKFILEGYDGLCLLSTVPGSKGKVCIRYPSNNSRVLFELLTNIAPRIKNQQLVAPL